MQGESRGASADERPPVGRAPWPSASWRRSLQLCLATLWLVDGLLQLQPFMFSRGFGTMLSQSASQAPRPLAVTIEWNGSLVSHHALLLGALFAAVQLLLAAGIAWRPTVKAALAASVTWSLLVWWFGEGFGGLLNGSADPLAGFPGPVLLYAVLAIVLWPAERPAPSVAEGSALGAKAARGVWAALFAGLAVAMVAGPAGKPGGVRADLVTAGAGQPSWLASVDRHAASLVGHGEGAAALLAALFAALAVSILLPGRLKVAVFGTGLVALFVFWALGQGFGGLFAGGQATDPSSGPALALLVLAYWPAPRPAGRPAPEGLEAAVT